jgi:hypothetical protein
MLRRYIWICRKQPSVTGRSGSASGLRLVTGSSRAGNFRFRESVLSGAGLGTPSTQLALVIALAQRHTARAQDVVCGDGVEIELVMLFVPFVMAVERNCRWLHATHTCTVCSLAWQYPPVFALTASAPRSN